ncbi:hypothetical protein NIA69_00865 [Gemmiger formicilis]|nr:hypothetical protein [Gemmiger formicilis]
MYRAREKQMSIYDYLPPYHGELCNANRWVRLAAAIDWDGFEKAYSALFAPGGRWRCPPVWRWAAGSSSCTMRRRTARSWRWCRKAPTCNIFGVRELHRRGAVLVPHGGAVPRPHSDKAVRPAVRLLRSFQ